MNICILGGTGLIGKAIQAQLGSKYSINTYGRTAFATLDKLQSIIDNQDVIIQLSGANIAQRWSSRVKQDLWDSRIGTTQLLAQAVAKLEQKPQRVIVASAIGYYPQTDCQHPLDETHQTPGTGFLAELAHEWEQQAQQILSAEETVITRFGVVLDKQQGALGKMLPAFKLGLGGPVAGGKQCFSWIHIQDLVNAIDFILQHPEIKGAINVTAPSPLSQKEFAQTLADTLNRPAFMPLPEWQLKLMFGEGAQVLTHSSCIIPSRLKQLGFQFQYPNAKIALKALCTSKR